MPAPPWWRSPPWPSPANTTADPSFPSPPCPVPRDRAVFRSPGRKRLPSSAGTIIMGFVNPRAAPPAPAFYRTVPMGPVPRQLIRKTGLRDWEKRARAQRTEILPPPWWFVGMTGLRGREHNPCQRLSFHFPRHLIGMTGLRDWEKRVMAQRAEILSPVPAKKRIFRKKRG